MSPIVPGLLLAARAALPGALALVGGTVIDGTGRAPIPRATVLVVAGKIACVGPAAACPVPEGTTVKDVSGKYVTPGLVDAHVHFSQTGWADGRPDAADARAFHPYEKVEADLEAHPERFFRSQLCSGVTAVFDVGGYPWTLHLADRASSDPLAPHVLAAGPLLSTLDHWLNLPAERQFILLRDADTARAGVAYLASHGSHAVKVWYIVDAEHPVDASAPAVLAAGAEAKRAGLPLIVHATGLAEAKVALRAGAALLVHSVDDLPIDAEFIELARRNGTIYCPTLTVADGYLRLREAIAAKSAPSIDDPNGCVDPTIRARLQETPRLPPVDASRLAASHERLARRATTMAENLRRVAEAGIPIAMGTDAGNPLTLHGPSVYAEMEAMQKAGMPAANVLVAATRGGSRAMGLDNEIGTIEKGKAADLLVLDADPTSDIANFRRIRFVVRGGEFHTISELTPAPASGPSR